MKKYRNYSLQARFKGFVVFENELTYPNNIRFRQIETPKYFIDYIPGEQNKLVITFENAENPDSPRPDALRYAWGSLYLHKKGYCVLGIKPKTVDWYRGECLHKFFRSSQFKAFTSSFNKVFFYGSSMGGFAAMVFSDAVPNSTVIAFNPQTTLMPERADWDKRYPQGSSQNWEGDFNDARSYSVKARNIYIAYDPFCEEDNRHITRMAPHTHNLVLLKMPFVGHVMMMWLQQAGVLEAFLEGAFSEKLSAYECHRLARKRRNIARYYHMLGLRVKNQKYVFTCILNLMTLSELPVNFPNIMNELIRKLNSKSAIEINRIPLRTRDELSKPHISKGYFLILKKASDLGLINESLNYSLQLVRYGPYNTFILTNISECYLKLKNYHQALFYIDEAINGDPNVANIYRLKSRILLALECFDDAVDSALKSLDLEKNNKHGLIDLFNAAVKANKPDLASFSAERISTEFGDTQYKQRL